ncbi:unnamed protein product [Lota lota]
MLLHVSVSVSGKLVSPVVTQKLCTHCHPSAFHQTLAKTTLRSSTCGSGALSGSGAVGGSGPSLGPGMDTIQS